MSKRNLPQKLLKIGKPKLPQQSPTNTQRFFTRSSPFIRRVKQFNKNLIKESEVKYFNNHILNKTKNYTSRKNNGFLVPLYEMFPDLINRCGEKIILHRDSDLSISFGLILNELEKVNKEILFVENMEKLKKLTVRQRYLNYYKKNFIPAIKNWRTYKKCFNNYYNNKFKPEFPKPDMQIERRKFNEELMRYEKRKKNEKSEEKIRMMLQVDGVKTKELIKKIENSKQIKEKKKISDEILQWKKRNGTPYSKKKEKPCFLRLFLEKHKGIMNKIEKEGDSIQINIVNEMEFFESTKLSSPVNNSLFLTATCKSNEDIKEDIQTIVQKEKNDKKKIVVSRKSKMEKLVGKKIVILSKNKTRKRGKSVQQRKGKKSQLGYKRSLGVDGIVKIDFTSRKRAISTRYEYPVNRVLQLKKKNHPKTTKSWNNTKGMKIQPIVDRTFDDKCVKDKNMVSRTSFSEINMAVLQDGCEKVYGSGLYKHFFSPETPETPDTATMAYSFDQVGRLFEQFEIQLNEFSKDKNKSEAVGEKKNKPITFRVRIEELIGRGGFSSVYRGNLDYIDEKGTDISKVIAVKKTCIKNDFFKKKFVVVEIEILRRLNSPYLIKYFGCKYSSTEKEYSIIMEYMDMSLAELIQKKKIIPVEDSKIIITHILKGLEYLHSKKIVHRDLKSSNVLCNRKGEIKISDFGVSSILSKYNSVRTSAVGTPNFSSLEILVGGDYSFPTDIWSLGAVTIHMLTGKIPFSEFGHLAIGKRIEELDMNKYINTLEVVENAKDFLKRCLEKDWKKRESVTGLLKHKFLVGKISLI